MVKNANNNRVRTKLTKCEVDVDTFLHMMKWGMIFKLSAVFRWYVYSGWGYFSFATVFQCTQWIRSDSAECQKHCKCRCVCEQGGCAARRRLTLCLSSCSVRARGRAVVCWESGTLDWQHPSCWGHHGNRRVFSQVNALELCTTSNTAAMSQTLALQGA